MNTKAADESQSADGLSPPRRYIAVFAISLGTILTAIDGAMINIALPTLAHDFQIQPSAAVLLVTVYQLVMMMALLPLSALGQRFGHRTVYQYGLLVFIVAAVLCFFARSFPVLVVVRGVQALGAAALLSVGSAMIRSIYPSSRLGRGLSLNTAIAAIAASFAPVVGGAVLAVAEWPWLFAIIAPFGLLSIVVGWNALPDNHRHSSPYDVLGAVMCAMTFGLAISGLESAVHNDSPYVSLGLITLSVMLGVVFVRREFTQSAPVFPVDLLRMRTIALPCIGSMAAYMAMMILTISLPFRLQQQFHFTPAGAGAALAPIPLVSMIVAPTSGFLSDRFRAGVLGGIGMAIAFCGLMSLAFLPAAPNHFDLLWRVALCGLGFGMFFSPNSRQVIAAAPAARSAAAGALFTTIRGAGQTLGATVIAALLAVGIGIGSVPSLVTAGLALLAGFCSLAALKPTARITIK